MVQDVSMATIYKVRFYSNQYFAQKRPVKMIFWTIPLLSITFCLFRTSPNSLTLYEFIFRQFWALWKLPFLAAFHDHLTSLTSGAYCWGLTFLSYPYMVLYLKWSNRGWRRSSLLGQINKTFPEGEDFGLGKKGGKAKKRTREKETEKDDCGPQTRKFFWDCRTSTKRYVIT